MIKTIVVPLDGSQFAEHALPWARSLARRCGATTKLVRVRSIIPAPASGEGMMAYDPDAYEYTRNEENEYMAKVVAAWTDRDAQTTLTGDLLDSNETIAGILEPIR